jgi:hypothetical protein
MLYESVEERLDNAYELAWKGNRKKAYAELDLLLQAYPDDVEVHHLYAQLLEEEVYTSGEKYGRFDDRLRRIRKHYYHLIRHCEDIETTFVYHAISELAGQAEAFGKKQHAARLKQILHEVYGK